MRQTACILSVMVMVLYACTNRIENPTVPSGIIKPHKMAEIMVDIHISEAGTEHLTVSPDSFHYYNLQMYFAIFKKHKVTREKFIKSLNFYIEHPVLMEKVYKEVTEKLDELSNEQYD